MRMHKGMMYHIITVMGVFCALGIGILIGSLLNGEQLMTAQQSKLMHELGEHLNVINDEKNKLKSELGSAYQKLTFKDTVIEYLCQQYGQEQLEGYNVALVLSGEEKEVDDIKKWMTQAGANVISMTSVSNLNTTSEAGAFNDFVLNIFERIPSLPEDEYIDTVSHAAENLIYAIITGKHTDIIYEMANMQYIEAHGEYDRQADYIVFVGPNKNGKEYVKNVDIPMLNIINQHDIPFIVVEKTNSQYSAVDIFRELGFSTVDNIDTPLGKVSMLMVFKGAQGNFGFKEASSNLLPYFE